MSDSNIIYSTDKTVRLAGDDGERDKRDDLQNLGYNKKGTGLRRLVREVNKHGLFVSGLGGERYQLATDRGRIILRDGSFYATMEAIRKYRP